MSPIIIIGNTSAKDWSKSIQQQKSDIKVSLTLPKRKVLPMNLHSMVKTPEANYVQELQKLKHKHAAEFKRKEKKGSCKLNYTSSVYPRCRRTMQPHA